MVELAKDTCTLDWPLSDTKFFLGNFLSRNLLNCYFEQKNCSVKISNRYFNFNTCRKEISNAVFNTLEKWGLVDKVRAFVFDTTSSNTGRFNDYTGFSELVMILLGGTLPKGNKIRKLGAYHQARWMAKAIYSTKLLLLRSEFAITGVEEKALYRICGFIVVNYIKPWFTANKTTEAPWNDILLLKNLNKYKEKDAIVAGACLQKFVNHLWYLADEPVLFSLFDDNVPLEEKQLMTEKLRS
ncbi:hypothetical protein ILUMI_01838 [Ignelater luminosus]|uniref:Uncharacterized protein n=1 Tax=Ignelater luminosus TaxID=2038154 RepID=A0A8K0DJ99_IGNLU|nr:hypothetical protein ILUMI_01838 [Ignelater luminosus]